MAHTDERKDASVELEFFAKAEHLSEVRKLVERLATKTRLGKHELDDLLTAVDEAAANAIRHGSPKGERSLVRVVCHPLHAALVVEVRDQGTGFTVPQTSAMPSPEALGGRGLPLMEQLADELVIERAADSTTVTMTRSLAARGPEAAILGS